MVERRGTQALADPLFVLPAWLRHATRGGAVVEAHSVVTTGTWCGLLQARAGDAAAKDLRREVAAAMSAAEIAEAQRAAREWLVTH